VGKWIAVHDLVRGDRFHPNEHDSGNHRDAGPIDPQAGYAAERHANISQPKYKDDK
jgi:hypothetical protein